jgi:hypothetical protein
MRIKVIFWIFYLWSLCSSHNKPLLDDHDQYNRNYPHAGEFWFISSMISSLKVFDSSLVFDGRFPSLEFQTQILENPQLKHDKKTQK